MSVKSSLISLDLVYGNVWVNKLIPYCQCEAWIIWTFPFMRQMMHSLAQLSHRSITHQSLELMLFAVRSCFCLCTVCILEKSLKVSSKQLRPGVTWTGKSCLEDDAEAYGGGGFDTNPCTCRRTCLASTNKQATSLSGRQGCCFLWWSLYSLPETKKL